jgi:hypothetical protein
VVYNLLRGISIKVFGWGEASHKPPHSRHHLWIVDLSVSPLWLQTGENQKKPGLDYKLRRYKVSGDCRLFPYEGPYAPPANCLGTHLAIACGTKGCRILLNKLTFNFCAIPATLNLPPSRTMILDSSSWRTAASRAFCIIHTCLAFLRHFNSLPREIALLPH